MARNHGTPLKGTNLRPVPGAPVRLCAHHELSDDPADREASCDSQTCEAVQTKVEAIASLDRAEGLLVEAITTLERRIDAAGPDGRDSDLRDALGAAIAVKALLVLVVSDYVSPFWHPRGLEEAAAEHRS